MTETQAGYVENESGRLYYEMAGSGEPVVFVHGFTLDTRMWDDQWHVFAQSYRVIRYDARGFGRSSDPERSYAHHRDLKALLHHLRIERPHVIGLSMGGGIALDYAVSYPEALSSLVLIDSSLGGYTWGPNFRPSVLQLADVARGNGLALAKEIWTNNALFAPSMEKPAVKARLAEMVGAYRGARWLTDDPIEQLDPPAAECLDEIVVPVLALVGEHDLPDFHGIADYVVGHVSNGRKVVVQGAGHMANMEEPEQVNRLILDFLANSGR